jgi:hypothetical protein
LGYFNLCPFEAKAPLIAAAARYVDYYLANTKPKTKVVGAVLDLNLVSSSATPERDQKAKFLGRSKVGGIFNRKRGKPFISKMRCRN